MPLSRNPCSSGLSFRSTCPGWPPSRPRVAILVLVDYPFGGVGGSTPPSSRMPSVAILVLVDYPFGVAMFTPCSTGCRGMVAILVLVDYPFGGVFVDIPEIKLPVRRNPCSSGLSFRRRVILVIAAPDDYVAILVLVDYPFGG